MTVKKIIIFDLDGTLAESKQPIDTEMSSLLSTLLTLKKVAVISGGGFPQLEKQVVSHLHYDIQTLQNLYIFPTKGAVLYTFNGQKWSEVYEHTLSESEKSFIQAAFTEVSTQVNFLPKEHFGKVLEDRGSQLTFSALGQNATPDIKKSWDPDFSKRKKLQELLMAKLPDFQVEIGGTTSIDITKKGIDKGFAILQLAKYTAIPITDMLFIGDSLFPGGNDYPATKSGVDTIAVKDYNETKKIIKKIIETK